MQTKKTALYNQHTTLNAKMVPFAGFIMPVQYSGIIDEHLTVRKNVGIFDVSHMGEFEFRGIDAEKFLNRMTTNNVARLEPGDIQYSAMLYDDGGVVDDLLVYRFEDHYMTVVNASNLDKDYEWLKSHLQGDVQMEDISDQTTLLAIQGPKAVELVKRLTDMPLDEIKYYNFRLGQTAGIDTIISRTGYTGEEGFELYVSRDSSASLWEAIFDAGQEFGVKPIGLGARDSLRLEACYNLYGNDMDETTNPIEAGLGWIVKSKKRGGFIGKEPVLKAKQETTRKLIGFILIDKGIARHNTDIYIKGEKVGYVTSGGFSPIMNKAIGLGYVNKPYTDVGNIIEIDLRGRRIKAEIVQTPFYKRG
ncbi:MAG: glycine cleavage system aminomethyltransferase GcvT [Candidatus Hatepunaea meridiana]|nr:glycine cleavage system aminomethyltransferase GcvT [Candidatus Hatepunaea meridiana]